MVVVFITVFEGVALGVVSPRCSQIPGAPKRLLTEHAGFPELWFQAADRSRHECLSPASKDSDS